MNVHTQKETIRAMLYHEVCPSNEVRVEYFHQMQENQPIRYRPEYDLWEVFSYKEVQQVLSDAATFAVDGSQPQGLPGALLQSDTPRHRQIRNVGISGFNRRSIEKLTPRLIQIVDEMLEPAIAKGKMDAVADFANPLPVHTIAEVLGVPAQDHARFRQWSYQLLDQVARRVEHPANDELLQYFSDLLNERKFHPQDNLISALLAAEEKGAYLTREEIMDISLVLMLAGNVNTAKMLGYAILRLCRQPEIYQELRDDPSLIPGAIEEILRYDFSCMNTWRTTRHDTMLGGCQIQAGQQVVAWIVAANFDEAYFPHAAQFNIRRSPSPHLTFGYGPHSCLGSALARLEGRVALERIVAHCSDIRLDLEHPVAYVDQATSSRLIQSLGVLLS